MSSALFVKPPMPVRVVPLASYHQTSSAVLGSTETRTVGMQRGYVCEDIVRTVNGRVTT